jgi:choline dehydrogenase-like flavoprotein
LAGKKIPLSQGRLLGGSSAINGEAFVANSKFSLDKWASLCGDSGWGWDGLAPYFQKSCTLTMPSQAASDYLGLDYVDQHHAKLFNGPVQASFPEVLNDPLPRAWVQTLKGLGSSITSDPFTGKATGGYVNAMSVHPITKQRSHSANAYYDPVRSRSNLCLITSAFVNKVVFDGKDTDVVAKGVSYTCNGSSVTIIARKEVVLAAGVFNTPKLLELSGIGSASLLARYHISVVINNANVGENLQDHPNAGFSFEV